MIEQLKLACAVVSCSSVRLFVLTIDYINGDKETKKAVGYFGNYLFIFCCENILFHPGST